MIVVALQSECSDLIGRGPDDFPCVQCSDERGFPLSGRDAWSCFAVVVDADRIGCAGDRDEASVCHIDKHVSGALEHSRVDIGGLSVLLGESLGGESLGPDLMPKIDRGPQQSAKVANRALRISQMLPSRFHYI